MHSDTANTSTQGDNLDFIGDHLALNFINTLRANQGQPFEALNSDQDVIDWFELAGISTSSQLSAWPTGKLLRSARELRDISLKAVIAKRSGKRPSLEVLNSFLEEAVSHLQLVGRAGTKIELKKIYGNRSVRQFLSPVTESVADLLVNGDFTLIRRCEGRDCVLWFYDRTKAHRRRWCSSAVCGNRAKVAAFRARAHES